MPTRRERETPGENREWVIEEHSKVTNAILRSLLRASLTTPVSGLSYKYVTAAIPST